KASSFSIGKRPIISFVDSDSLMISSPSFLSSFMTFGVFSASEIRISILPSLTRLDPLPPDSIIVRIVGWTFEAREIEALPLITPSLRGTVDGCGGGGIGGGGGGNGC